MPFPGFPGSSQEPQITRKSESPNKTSQAQNPEPRTCAAKALHPFLPLRAHTRGWSRQRSVTAQRWQTELLPAPRAGPFGTNLGGQKGPSPYHPAPAPTVPNQDEELLPCSVTRGWCSPITPPSPCTPWQELQQNWGSPNLSQPPRHPGTGVWLTTGSKRIPSLPRSSPGRLLS